VSFAKHINPLFRRATDSDKAAFDLWSMTT